MTQGLIDKGDGKTRCFWPGGQDDYLRYHDEEWGRPVVGDTALFEKICLEGFQSGLSWLTILRKRENFREAFSRFDYHQIAAYGDEEVARLLSDAGIVRHGGKIRSTINNAKRAIDMERSEGSLASYFWSFEANDCQRPDRVTHQWLSANPVSDQSKALAKDLKKRGWSFVGPTTVYAFMQAMGMVNDHIEGCFCRQQVEAARNALTRP